MSVYKNYEVPEEKEFDKCKHHYMYVSRICTDESFYESFEITSWCAWCGMLKVVTEYNRKFVNKKLYLPKGIPNDAKGRND